MNILVKNVVKILKKWFAFQRRIYFRNAQDARASKPGKKYHYFHLQGVLQAIVVRVVADLDGLPEPANTSRWLVNRDG